MFRIDEEVISISRQIILERLRIKAAISRGVVFEEVKEIVLNLRELEKKLDDCVSAQIQQTRDSEQKTA